MKGATRICLSARDGNFRRRFGPLNLYPRFRTKTTRGLTNQAEAKCLGFFSFDPKESQRVASWDRNAMSRPRAAERHARDTSPASRYRSFAQTLGCLSLARRLGYQGSSARYSGPKCHGFGPLSGANAKCVRELMAAKSAPRAPSPEIEPRLRHAVPLAPLADAHSATLLSLN
jgi:hypothetical protein